MLELDFAFILSYSAQLQTRTDFLLSIESDVGKYHAFLTLVAYADGIAYDLLFRGCGFNVIAIDFDGSFKRDNSCFVQIMVIVV